MEISIFLRFVHLIIARDVEAVTRQLRTDSALATTVLVVGATRENASEYFFPEISHYIYEGDTPLHMAAAAFSRAVAEVLVSHGADRQAKNRRGAQPLHYAADGRSRSNEQAEVIEYLISIGAEPNAMDKSGVAPLHRAVRRRSIDAVRALLDGGADARRPNKSGSTPLHLAVQNTGASGSGSDEARDAQAEIIKLLLARGARASDKDAKGKTAEQAATSEWIRELLKNASALAT